MRNLSVTLIQDRLHWHDPPANRAMFAAHFDAIGKTDLVVLPEMFTSGFSMDPGNCFETMAGETLAWMQYHAANLDAVITGSLPVKLEEGVIVNRLLWVRPDASYDYYDKRHLFRYGQEHVHFTAGEQRVVVELFGWRVALLVCYDLRFPVWSRNRDDYDLALYVANWPAARQFAWDALLVARAIENLSYVAGVNRIGEDGIGHSFSGGSVILDYGGQPRVSLADKPGIATTTLDGQGLNEFRQHFQAILDADEFVLKI